MIIVVMHEPDVTNDCGDETCLSQYSQSVHGDPNAIVFFVIPTGQSEVTCSMNLLYAYQVICYDICMIDLIAAFMKALHV